MHDFGCSCCACVQVRNYLAGDDDHPACCVCPLCAAQRMQERHEARAFEQAYVGTISTEKGVNAWWKHYDGPGVSISQDETVKGFQRLRDRILHEMQGYWGIRAGRGEIDPPQPIADKQDAVEVFDLLHDMGIPISRDET